MMEAKEYVERKLPTPDGFADYWKELFDHIIFVRRDEEIWTAEHTKNRNIKRLMLRKNTNFGNLYDRCYVSVVVSNSKRIEQHYYMVEREINSVTLKEKLWISLFTMSVLEKGKIVDVSYYDYPLPGYGFGKRAMCTHGQFAWNYYSFENDWVSNSPLRDLDISIHTNKYEIQRLYNHRSDLRMCKDKGMNNMFKDIVGNCIDWRIVTRSRVKKYWVYIAANDMNFKEFKSFNMLLKNGVKLSHMNYDALPNFDIKIDKSKHEGISITRIMNYLYKQERRLSYYYDYLNTLVDIKVKAKTEQVFFPKSLVDAHDKAVRTLNIIQIKADKKKLKNINDKLIELEYDGSKYAVVSPKSLFDITQEGKNLEHCVGGSHYLEGHQKGKFAIMFVRLKNDKSKSLYTLTYEYRKQVSALHGYKNRENSDPNFAEIKRFVYQEWLTWVKEQDALKKQKKAIVQSSQQIAMQG